MRVSRRERFIHRLAVWSGVRDGEMLPKWALALRWILCPLETYGRWYAERIFAPYVFTRNALDVNGQYFSLDFLARLDDASRAGVAWSFTRDEKGRLIIDDVTDLLLDMWRYKAI